MNIWPFCDKRKPALAISTGVTYSPCRSMRACRCVRSYGLATAQHASGTSVPRRRHELLCECSVYCSM